MVKEYIHIKYFEDRKLLAIKEMIYFIFLIFTLGIISILIESLVKIIIPQFNISMDSFYLIFSFFVFFLMVVDKLRIGFIENLWLDMNHKKKKYKHFIVWFEGMEKHSFTKKEMEYYLKKHSRSKTK